MPRLASASVTVSLRAKDGADGKPGADGAPARYVYLRGTAHSSQHFDGVTTATTPALIKTSGGETDLSISSRGLTVVTLDRQTLRVASRQTFDTLTDSAARNQQLADLIASVDDSVFLCIVSWDAFYLSKSKGGDVVIEALKAFGLGAVDRARLDYRCPFAFLGQKGLPEGYAYMAEGGNSLAYPDSHDVEFSVYTAGGAIAYAPAGRKGAMPRLRGEWKSGTTYQNQQDYVDVVLYDGSYYQCVASAGAVTSTTNPKSDTTNWQPFNDYDNLATGVLLAGKGLIQVLGAGKAFIGQTSTGTGWEMTQGQIRHTGTGLALTADGKLSVPNPGALTISGGQTIEAAGRNLLKNSKYQKTTTEYLVQTCQSYEPLVKGERYTLVCRVDLAGNAVKLGIWDRGGMSSMSRAVTPDADGVAVVYFTYAHSAGGLDGIRLYQLKASNNSSAGSEVTLHWAMLLPGWAIPRREWYPAPEEDASAQLTAYKTEVTTELSVMNDQIASKVAQTTFDALGNRVSSAESKITQQAGLIAQKVSQTTFDTFKTGYDTFKQQTTEGLSEVKQTASGIQSTVTSHTTQLSNLSTKIDKAAPFAEVTLDATGLDPDTWYPVTLGILPDRQYTIRVLWRLNSSVVPPWATHKNGYSVLAAWQSNGSAWGEQVVKRTILEYTQSFAKNDATVLGNIGQLKHTSEEYFYVRGGGKYRVTVTDAAPSKAIALHETAYTSSATEPETLPLLTTAPSRPVPDLDTAQQTANTAKTNAASALTQLTNMASDNILSPVEKQQAKREWDAIQSEYTKNTSAASTAGVSSTAYTSAYNTLSGYLTPLLSSLTTDSAITGSTFRSRFKAYYDARTDLLNAIAKAARDKADSAQSKADSAYQSAQNALTKADGAVAIKDTRKDNQTPGWYGDNYPQQVVREFKETEVIGLKAAFPAVVTETFCTLETYVQWNSGGASDSSGGYPRQTAYSRGRLFTRFGTSATAWSAWRDSTTTLEVETQIDQARDRLWLGVTSNLLNLFRDGSFERDVNTVSNTDAGSSTVSFPAWRDVYEPYDSSTSGKYRDVMPTSARVMAVRNWASGAARVILGQHVPVEPGKTYTVVLWRHDGGTRSAQDGVRWLNVRTPASSPTWTSVELADQQPSWVYGWHREAFVVGPAPAAAQSLQVFLGTASSTAAAWTLVDGVMVVEGDLRTADLLPETFVTDLRSDLSDALYQTGINIATGEVTVQADRFRVRGQNGGTGELLFDTETGLLRTELIDAEALTVSNLAAGRGTIDFLTAPEPGTGGMGVYIGRGAFDEAMSSTSDFTKAKGASLSKTFSHSSGQTGPVNGAVAEHALYTVTAGSSKAATVRVSGQVRVDLSATGRLDTASFGQGVISKLAEGTVTASVALTVGGQTQKFIATGLRCGGPTWDSEYVGGSTVLSNPQSTASRSWTVAVDETVYVPAGQQAKVVVRYSYTLDRKSSSFTANAKITASQSYNTLTATVQTRVAALCADGLMFQTSTANYLRIIPGTGNSSTNGFRLQSATPLQLDAPVALNRLQHKVISSMAQAESSNAAFWANVSLFVFNGTGRFILPDVNLSPQFNHFRLYTKNAVKITTNGTGEMGGLATGLYEFTSTADFIFTLDYIEATKKWVVSLG